MAKISEKHHVTKNGMIKRNPKKKNVIATVRVAPIDEDNFEHSDLAMEFEYKDQDFEYFLNWLKTNPDIKPGFEFEGNAFCVEGKPEAIRKFRNVITSFYNIQDFKKYGFDGFVDIEWNYWAC